MVSHFYRAFNLNMSAEGAKLPLLVDKYHAPQFNALVTKLQRLDSEVSTITEVLEKYRGDALGYSDDLDHFSFIRDRYQRKGAICVSAWAERVHSGAITLSDIYRNYDVNDDVAGVPLFDLWTSSQYMDVNPIGYHLLGIPIDQMGFWANRNEVSFHPYYIAWYNSIMISFSLESLRTDEYESLYSAALEFRLITDQGGGAEYYVGRSEAQSKLPKDLLVRYATRARALWEEHEYHRWYIKDYARMICDDWSVSAIAAFHHLGADHETVQRLYNLGIKDSKTIADVIGGVIPEDWALASSQL